MKCVAAMLPFKILPSHSRCVILYIMSWKADEYSHTLSPYITEQARCRYQMLRGEQKSFIFPVQHPTNTLSFPFYHVFLL